MGMEIVGSYLDGGISGMIPLEKRPEGGRLLEDANNGLFKQVVVYRLDRIGRKAPGHSLRLGDPDTSPLPGRVAVT